MRTEVTIPKTGAGTTKKYARFNLTHDILSTSFGDNKAIRIYFRSNKPWTMTEKNKPNNYILKFVRQNGEEIKRQYIVNTLFDKLHLAILNPKFIENMWVHQDKKTFTLINN